MNGEVKDPVKNEIRHCQMNVINEVEQSERQLGLNQVMEKAWIS
jgi:hypothetical protein